MLSGTGKAVALVGQGPVAARVYGLLQAAGVRVSVAQRYDESSPPADVVVECVGGVSPAYEVAMAALGRGISCVTANALLLAVHGRVLQAASEGQHAFFGYAASLGVARPVLGWLREEPPQQMTLALASGANAVLERMAQRNELAADAERHLAQAGHDLRDVSGKATLAQALALHGACTGRWLAAGAAARQGLEQVEVADLARLRRHGLGLRYGAEVFAGGVRAGLLAIGAGNPLAQCFERDVLVVEAAQGARTVLTCEAVGDEATAQALCAEALRAPAAKPKAFAPGVSLPASGARGYFVRVPYAAREGLLAEGFAPAQEHVDNHGTWTAVGLCAHAPAVADGLCVPVAGDWQPEAAGLRLVG